MANEEKLKQAFGKVKEDIEGLKDSLAFALKRISKIESAINEKAIEDIVRNAKAEDKKSGKRKIK